MQDGFTTLSGGMHGGLDPALLRSTQMAKGVNVSVRGGLVHTRPAFTRVAPSFNPGGAFQGARRWVTPDGDRVVVIYSGVAYLFNPNDETIASLGPVTRVTVPAYLCAADRYMLVQDGERSAIIEYDVSSHTAIVRATSQLPETMQGDPFYFCEGGTPEPPEEGGEAPPPGRIISGTIAHFCHGRIHLVPRYVPGTEDSGSRYFISSDILLPNLPSNVLDWTEALYLNSGGAFGLPDDLGDIRALASQRNAATGSGVGALVVFARNGVAAFNVALPREGVYDGVDNPQLISPGWKDQAIGQVLFYGSGTDSPWAVVNVNNDLAYRGFDGIRFLQYSGNRARSGSVQNALSNLPMSSEVRPYLDQDGPQLARVSGVFGLSRLLMSTVPSGNTRTFKGLVSLDTAIASGIGTELPPAYDGIWTGLSVGGVVSAFRNGTPAVYVFTESPSAIYRIDETSKLDNGTQPIQSKIETKALFAASPFIAKELQYVDLWVSGLVHSTEFVVYYRPDNYPLWTRMGERRIEIGEGSLPQERRRLRFSAAGCGGSRPHGSLRVGNTFQFLIEWRGWAQLDRLLAEASEQKESPPLCSDDPDGAVIEADDDHIAANDFTYVVGS